jgi:hypothetical protein
MRETVAEETPASTATISSVAEPAWSKVEALGAVRFKVFIRFNSVGFSRVQFGLVQFGLRQRGSVQWGTAYCEGLA